MEQYVLCIEKTAMLLHYVKEAHALGYRCILMTSNRFAYNRLTAEEQDIVDVVIEIDTNDLSALSEKAKTLAQQYTIVGVFSFLEYAIPAVAYIAEALGLPGNTPASTLLARNKALQRQQFAKDGVPSADFHEINTIADLYELNATGDLHESNTTSDLHELNTTADLHELNTTSDLHGLNVSNTSITYPVILKPVDLSASRNVYRCDSFKELEAHYKESVGFDGHPYGGKVSGRYLVEEFLRGHEYSVESFMYQGQFHFVGITNKETLGEGTFVEIEHDVSLEILEPLKEKVKAVVEQAVRSLGICHGFTHTEIKVDGEDIRIVEVNNRLAGDKIPNLMKVAYGIDCWRAVISLAVGQCPDCTPVKKEAASVRHIVAEKGKISSIVGEDKALSLPGVVDVHLYDCIGKNYRGLIDDSDLIIGYVIATGKTLQSSHQHVMDAIAAISVSTEP